MEWIFDGMHKGTFANVEATGKSVQIFGCSFHEYDLERRKILSGRLYFDLATLLRQVGVAA